MGEKAQGGRTRERSLAQSCCSDGRSEREKGREEDHLLSRGKEGRRVGDGPELFYFLSPRRSGLPNGGTLGGEKTGGRETGRS